MQQMEWISATGSKRTKLTHPYSYDPITTWTGNAKPDGSVYTDRLFQWGPEKHDQLCIKHFGDRSQYWGSRSVSAIQAFLRDYLDAPELVLCEVQEHCNQATGYPCWFLAYRKHPDSN